VISGSNRVLRGGSWNNNASNCRVANRNNNNPSNSNNNNGFRLVNMPYAEDMDLRIHVPSKKHPASYPHPFLQADKKQQSLKTGRINNFEGFQAFIIERKMERFPECIGAQRSENGETENGRMEIIILAPDGNVRLMTESGGEGAQTTQIQRFQPFPIGW
jgi:hypothetical protein